MEINFLHFLQGFHNRYLDSIMMFRTKLGNAGVIWFVWSVCFNCAYFNGNNS